MWKHTYLAEEWTSIIESYIDEQIKMAEKKQQNKTGRWFSFYDLLLHTLAPVYIEENYFNRLLALVNQNKTLNALLVYQPFLVKDYATELIEMFIPAFKEAAANANSRSHYADLVKKMKKVMKDVPGSGQYILNLAREFRSLYIKRPAMIDELRTLTT